ncbi:MAG: PLP-dependent aminotransferase family protein, partial [Patulibacter sp.]|nr:PLP-dependent aminotransferase family protein [Patulibacter sp.]
ARQGAAVRVSPAVARALPLEVDAIEAPQPPAWRLRLHPAATPLGTLDRRAWNAALRTALREAPEAALASNDAAGDPSLRAALATQLSRSRGVVTDPLHITITSGVTDALRGLAPILRARGGRVAVEDPGFMVHRGTLLASGLEVVPVPADHRGLDVAALTDLDVGAVLLTPAHQMPLGVPLSPERRAALVGWARATDTLLLEDDYDGELRYDRRGVRSLHALAPDRVVYLGTTSKVLSPAVRVGWCVTPPALTGEVQGWRLPAGAPPSNVVQLALAELIRTGAFDRGVAWLRRRCAAQRAALLAAFEDVAPHFVPTGVEAGLVLSLRVPGISSWDVLQAAQARGVELFALDDADGAILLVGFGLVDPTAAMQVAREVVDIVELARL